jgi:hypothetical protein
VFDHHLLAEKKVDECRVVSAYARSKERGPVYPELTIRVLDGDEAVHPDLTTRDWWRLEWGTLTETPWSWSGLMSRIHARRPAGKDGAILNEVRRRRLWG